MRSGWVAILAVVGIAAFGGARFVAIRHRLAMDRAYIGAAWAEVELALAQRAEVVPSLVQAMEGDAAREKEAVAAVAVARVALESGRGPQRKIQANAQLDGALARLLLAAENYPRLRSSESFLRLQDELSSAENGIAVERRKYNDALQKYNTQIELFPANLVAALAGFCRDDAYFRTGPGADMPPGEKVLSGRERSRRQ